MPTNTKVELKGLIEKGKFTFVNSNITPENFPAEAVRSEDYKIFHFDKYISSGDAVREIESAGYLPANIYELLSWKDWNGKDWVVGLGSSCVLSGRRGVPGLYGFLSGRDLGLDWWDGEWDDDFRFLAVRYSAQGLGAEKKTLSTLDTLKPSERIQKMKEESEERYAGFDIDTKNIATALNMIHKIGEVLDEIDSRIKSLEK